ncbi:MAG: tetratricopeptide repeat protein, partial [Burkholderiales bacterium]|nr:tetratricopeptide repeat protein [Burkholderiales bacterium]
NPALAAAAGILAHDLGMLEPAEDLLARAAAAEPRMAAAHAALGQVRMDLGRHDAALQAFQAATSLQPGPRASNNEGIALMALERRDEAARAFERALQLDPGYALASYNLARLHGTHDAERAFAHAQAAVKADPSNADAWLLLSDLLRRRQDHPNALHAVNLAIERAPERPIGWTRRAALLAETDQAEAARGEFVAAWTRFPSDLRAALGANLTLPHVYASHDHLEASRAAYTAGLERLHEAADRFRFDDAEPALQAARWTNFYLAYQGRDDRELQKRYGEFQRRVLERAAPDLFTARKRRQAGARLRVGFLSHYFYNCVVGRYFASWVTGLDPNRFEKIAYYTNAWVADDTRAIARATAAFHHVAGRPLAAIARQVIADELDILVFPEVGMHPDIATLAALRLAPVQCMAWGHPTTSGSPAMDWYLSSEPMEPPGAQAQYTERLALLPGLGTRYERPQVEGTPSREELGLPANRTLYLVPQSLFKMHPANDALIARILAEDENGLAVMFESNNAGSTRTFRARLDAALAAAGVAEDRVILLKPNLQHAAYMRLNAVCDVMIDTLHWSGGNTSIDAIAAALPVVTLPGGLMRGRQSAAMLRAMGLDELVAGDEHAFVAKAVQLGRDRSLRSDISQRMESARDALFARGEPIRALEDFLDAAARGA